MNDAKPSPAVEAFADFVIRRRKLVIVASLIVVAGAATGAAKLRTQTTFRIWSPPGSEEIVAYDRMTALFGSNDSALVVHRDPKGLLRNEALQVIDGHVRAFQQIPGIKRVDALTNFAQIKTSRPQHETGALAVDARALYVPDEANVIHRIPRAPDDLTRVSFEGHEGLIEYLVLTPDGRRLVSGGLDRKVIVWDAETGARLHTIGGLPERVSALILSPDGRRGYVGSLGAVVGFDVESGARRFRQLDESGYVFALAVAGEHLYSSAGPAIQIRNAHTGQVQKSVATNATVVALTGTEGAGVFAGLVDGTVLRVAGDDAAPTEALPATGVAVLCLAVGADGQVYAGHEDGTIRSAGADGTSGASHHSVAVTSVLALADGTVWSSAIDGGVAVQREGRDPRRLGGHRSQARRLVAAGDAPASVFSTGDDGAVYEWRTSDGAIISRVARQAPGDPAEPLAAIEGAPTGRIRVMNSLLHPIRVRVGTTEVTVASGAEQLLEGIAVAPMTSCAEGEACAPGQTCDYGRLDPVCINAVRVEARLLDASRPFWTGQALVEPEVVAPVQIPEETAFGVEQVALQSLPEESQLGTLLERHPTARAAADKVFDPDRLADPLTFVGPREAASLIEVLGDKAEPALAEVLGTISQATLYPNRLPLTPDRLRDTTRRLFRGPKSAASGFVINPARDTTILHLSLQELPHEIALQRMVDIHEAIEAHLAQSDQPSSYQLSGEVIMDTNLKKYTERDQQRLGPVFALMLMVVLGLMFRRVSGVLVPMSAVGLAVVCTMGTIGHVGGILNNLTGVVPQVVLAVCLGDSVHMFDRFLSNLRRGLDAQEATRESICFNFTPILMASITTFFGMLSLIPNRLPPIRDFGWMVAIGVLMAFLFSVTLLPALMSMLPVKARDRASAESSGQGSRRIDRALERLGRAVVAGPWRTLMWGGLIIVLISTGLTNVVFDTNPINQFKPGTPFRDASEFIEEHIAGPIGIELVLDTGEPNGLRKLENLEQVAKVQAHLEADPQITKVVSLADIHRDIRRAFHSDRQQEYALPEDDARAGAYYDAFAFSLPAGLELNNRVSDDQSATRVSIRVKNNSSRWAIDWQSDLTKWLQDNAPGLQPTITGKYMIFSHVNIGMTRSLFTSVSLAILLITLSMAVVLRSWRLGLISMIPNAVPAVLAVGVLGHLGKTLDMSIIVSLCVALGVVVDDTIHFLLKYSKYRGQMSPKDALITTYKDTGVALFTTTVVLCIAFGIFMWTDYAITSNFGLTTALVLAFGLILDFTLTPALCLLVDRGRRPSET